jgi:hypothetical protein
MSLLLSTSTPTAKSGHIILPIHSHLAINYLNPPHSTATISHTNKLTENPKRYLFPLQEQVQYLATDRPPDNTAPQVEVSTLKLHLHLRAQPRTQIDSKQLVYLQKASSTLTILTPDFYKRHLSIHPAVSPLSPNYPTMPNNNSSNQQPPTNNHLPPMEATSPASIKKNKAPSAHNLPVANITPPRSRPISKKDANIYITDQKGHHTIPWITNTACT